VPPLPCFARQRHRPLVESFTRRQRCVVSRPRLATPTRRGGCQLFSVTLKGDPRPASCLAYGWGDKIHSRNQRLDGLRAGISLVYEALCTRIFLASCLNLLFGQADLMKNPGISRCVNVGLQGPVDTSCTFPCRSYSPHPWLREARSTASMFTSDRQLAAANSVSPFSGSYTNALAHVAGSWRDRRLHSIGGHRR
jgi:hypothetical protein